MMTHNHMLRVCVSAVLCAFPSRETSQGVLTDGVVLRIHSSKCKCLDAGGCAAPGCAVKGFPLQLQAAAFIIPNATDEMSPAGAHRRPREIGRGADRGSTCSCVEGQPRGRGEATTGEISFHLSLTVNFFFSLTSTSSAPPFFAPKKKFDHKPVPAGVGSVRFRLRPPPLHVRPGRRAFETLEEGVGTMALKWPPPVSSDRNGGIRVAGSLLMRAGRGC